MADIIYKTKSQDQLPNYFYIPSEALIKDNDDINFYDEFETIEKIRQNEDGYFDFNKNLVDIGACYGSYTALLDFKYNYAFEPNKNKCCLFWTNMYLKDKVKNTYLYNCCLDEKNGVINYDGFYCECDDIQLLNAEKIETTFIDSFNVDNIGLIKIDAEGMEERILRGAVGTIIRNHYPPILFECWNVGMFNMTQEKRDSLFGFLNGLGYEILEYWGVHETHLAVHK